MKIVGFVIALALAAGSGTAAAQQSKDEHESPKKQGSASLLPDPKNAPAFRSLDRDGNGFISRVEAAVDKELLVDFAEMDLTKDSELSSAEYRSYYTAGYGQDYSR